MDCHSRGIAWLPRSPQAPRQAAVGGPCHAHHPDPQPRPPGARSPEPVPPAPAAAGCFEPHLLTVSLHLAVLVQDTGPVLERGQRLRCCPGGLEGSGPPGRSSACSACQKATCPLPSPKPACLERFAGLQSKCSFAQGAGAGVGTHWHTLGTKLPTPHLNPSFSVKEKPPQVVSPEARRSWACPLVLCTTAHAHTHTHQPDSSGCKPNKFLLVVCWDGRTSAS